MYIKYVELPMTAEEAEIWARIEAEIAAEIAIETKAIHQSED